MARYIVEVPKYKTVKDSPMIRLGTSYSSKKVAQTMLTEWRKRHHTRRGRIVQIE